MNDVESWTILKQIGIQRAGTNYFRKLVLLNFAGPEVYLIPPNALGKKHTTFTFKEMHQWAVAHPYSTAGVKLRPHIDEIKVVLQVRNPFSWSLAYIKHLNKVGKAQGRKVDDPGAHVTLIHARLNPCYTAWRRMVESQSGRCFSVRFEDLLQNFRRVLKKMSTRFGIGNNGRDLNDVQGEVLSSGDISKTKYTRREYYRKKDYLKELAPGVRNAILKATDWEAAEFFGYSRKG